MSPRRSDVVGVLVAVAASLIGLVSSPTRATAVAAAGRSGSGVAFGPPATVDPEYAGPSGLSCTSPDFCMLVDAAGSSYRYVDSSWLSPQRFEHFAGSPGSFTVEAVSCASPTRCVAVDDLGRATRFNGRDWAAPVTVDKDALLDVSCPTKRFCAATDHAGRAVFLTGSTWSKPAAITTGAHPFRAVSCVSSSFCEAVDEGGPSTGIYQPEKTFTYSGHAWKRAGGHAPVESSSLDCPSVTFCAASNGSVVATFDGSSWSSPTQVTQFFTLGRLSCASSSLCVIGDRDGNVYTYDGTTWSGPRGVSPGDYLAYPSCVSDSYCVIAGSYGTVSTLDDGTWSAPRTVDRRRGQLTSVSCPTSSTCRALDANGNELALHASNWSKPRSTGDDDLLQISCPAVDFCGAVSFSRGYIWDGHTWHASSNLQPDTDAYFSSISCPSRSFCLAVGPNGGNAATFDGQSWTTSPEPRESENDARVSCGTPAHCVAVYGTDGGTESYDGAAWHRLSGSLAQGREAYVSCAGSAFCSELSADGDTAELHGKTWKRSGRVRLAGFPALSCSSSTFCAAVGGNRIATWNGRRWSAHLSVGTHTYAAISCHSAHRCVAVGESEATMGGRSSDVSRANGQSASTIALARGQCGSRWGRPQRTQNWARW